MPETITDDQGTIFIGDKVVTFCQQFDIKIFHSTPYYAQANRQAEATNKIVIIDLIKKIVEEKSKHWDDMLSNSLWAIGNTKNNAMTMTPFQLTYDHDVMLPLKINVKSLRVVKQNLLSTND